MNGGGYDEAGTHAEMDPVWLLVCSRARGGCLTNNLGLISYVPSTSLIQAMGLITNLTQSEPGVSDGTAHVSCRNRVSRQDGNCQVDSHRVSRRSKRSRFQP